MAESKTETKKLESGTNETNIITALPYSWLSQVSEEVKNLDSVPLLGTPPPFPWEAFSGLLSKSVQINDLKIVLAETKWREKEEILAGLGDKPVCYPLSVVPLEGHLYFAIPKEELKELLFLSIHSEPDIAALEQEELLDEFYKFLLLEAAQSFGKVKFDPSLSLQVLEEPEYPEEACLCFDIEIRTPSKNFRGRILCTSSLQKSFQKKYTPATLSYPPGILEMVTVPVQLICGSTTISRKEWNGCSPGDFVVLDSCTIDPGQDKARVVLMVQNIPLFRGKIKDGSIKILEYPQLQEVQTQMVKEHEDEFDEEFETEEGTAHEEESSFEDAEMTDEHSEIGGVSHLESEVKEDLAPSEKEDAPHPAPKPNTEQAEKAPAFSLTKPEDLPMTITVEVARIQMSLQQLMQLAPGNMLELNVKPENGVDLVVSGRCIAKGELLKIGDALGVRILDKA
jgi:flagellar motor switch protein FliN